MIAFSYDMVGFNDTHFPYPEGFVAGPTNAYKTHRQFATNAECLLWNINLLGLQTWDSIRALDFLETLPDVDKTRLACTGESGGGTQTYMLGAVDDRLAAQAPIVMVSHIMQGGCSCENAPGLRLDYSNVEIAAVPAPRPQLLVAASGDWTKDTLTMEGPSIQSIYKLFDQANQFHYVRFDFPHNYNRTSREAVYQWLGDAFLHRADADIIKETAYTKEPDLDLRVFPGGKLPGDAVTQQQLIEWMMKRTKTQLAALEKNPVEHQKFLRTAWQHILQLNLPKGMVKSDFGLTQETVNYTRSRVNMQRTGKGDRLSAWLFYPTTNLQHTFVIVADQPGCLNTSDEPIGLAEKLLARGYPILLPDVFQSTDKHKEVELYYTTYNKTLMQERVQDLIAASAFVHIASEAAKNRIVICGGPSAILASPHVDAVLADCQQRNFTDEKTLLEPDLFVPGIQAIGGFAALADPKTVHLHNIKKSAKLDEDAVVKWVSQVK